MYINKQNINSILGSSIFSFDGTASKIVDLRSSTLLQCVQGNNPRSICFMIQTTTTTVDARILYTGSSESLKDFGVCINCGGAASGLLVIDIGNAYYKPSAGRAVTDGLWHNVLVTYDGTTLNIYVDGSLDNTATTWNGGSTATIASTLNTIDNSGNYLGSGVDGSSGKWIGSLKNVVFYDYVITYSDGKYTT